MDHRYARTPAGQAEIQARALGLARPVRNLLLLINASQPAAHWLAQVQGVSSEDLRQLLAEGLIAPANAPAAASPANPEAQAWQAQETQIEQASYAQLYSLLTAQAKPGLGLMRGYRLVLEVERAADVAALRVLARRLATQLRDDVGAPALRAFQRALADAVKPTP